MYHQESIENDYEVLSQFLSVLLSSLTNRSLISSIHMVVTSSIIKTAKTQVSIIINPNSR